MLSNSNNQPRSSSADRPQPKGAHNFQQHLFNQIFKKRLAATFTENAILTQPFEHFVKFTPEEVHRIISNFNVF